VAAENVCSIALVFIMFYGGFNTKWSVAKPMAAKAIVLSTPGVLLTAGITTIICKILFGLTIQESFLIGSVLSSTDAASVFAILRKHKLNLKDGTASILEVESDCNDPVSYMLTIIAISMLGNSESMNIVGLIVLQMVFGILVGVMIGNSRIRNKQMLIPFFDGVTSLAQILIFFLIGLLSFPHQMPKIVPLALTIVVSLTVIARPIAVYVLMWPFKCSLRQNLLISWAGLRGASSSVFAIMAVAAGISMKQDLFHIVFMVSLFSVAIQGTLLPYVAQKLDMVDNDADVRKTFNDYQEETALQLTTMYIPEGHNWANRKIKEVNMPMGALALMIKRGEENIIPDGKTVIREKDVVVLYK